jgi:hypothetical protein
MGAAKSSEKWVLTYAKKNFPQDYKRMERAEIRATRRAAEKLENGNANRKRG